GTAAIPATRSLREKPNATAREGQQRKVRRKEIFSFGVLAAVLAKLSQRTNDFRRVTRKIDAIDIARSRQIYCKFLLDTPGMGGKKQHALAQAGGLANIVSNKDDCFFALFPNSLKVAVELFPRQRIQRRK